MQNMTATARGVVAALAAAVLGLPAAVLAADDGATSANPGGGATYSEAPGGDGAISLEVARGAWLGRATRVSGRSAELAGETIAIQRRRSRAGEWSHVASVRVGDGGRYAATWKPRSAGRHHIRAVAASASSAADGGGRRASTVERLTVYRRVTATWYGPGFYGNRTACGQRLTRRTQGVAHKTLPCGAEVAIRVRGRSAVVPVIDRGPYAHGVAFDLTRATARRLGVSHTRRVGAAVLTR